MFNFVYGAMASNFALYTIDRFAAQPAQNALIFMIVGLVGATTQILGVRYLAPRFGEKRLVLFGLLSQIAGFVWIAVAPSFRLLYPASALVGLGNAFMRPSITALMSNEVPLREQGRIAGVMASVMSLTYVLGPLWAGVAYDHITPAAPYWSGALLLAA